MFNNHIKRVCNALTQSFSNAMAERVNGKIQEIKTVEEDIGLLKILEVQYSFFMEV